MKIVFFSDVHANLPALESFFKDIASIYPDAFYCLGDLVGYNVWPNEVVNEIRKRYIPTIMGNHEEALLNPMTDEKHSTSNKGLTRALLTKENKDYLINLPRQLSLAFTIEGQLFNLLMVHGSVKSTTDYMVLDYPENEVLAMMEHKQADVLLCGHTHKPFHRIIQHKDRFKHVINIGSVGKPKDEDPRGCYAVIELNNTTTSKDANGLQVTFHRFEYEVEMAAKAVEESEFDNLFAQALREAR